MLQTQSLELILTETRPQLLPQVADVSSGNVEVFAMNDKRGRSEPEGLMIAQSIFQVLAQAILPGTQRAFDVADPA